MLNGSSPGTVGLANPIRWFNTELFIKGIEHLIKHSHSSKKTPTVSVLDNHDCHMSIEVQKMAKSAEVTLLIYPPHCSNKLQPLDIAVFGPFKAYYNSDSWCLHNEHCLFFSSLSQSLRTLSSFWVRLNVESFSSGILFLAACFI